jgi:ATP-binding cassette subfamily C protein
MAGSPNDPRVRARSELKEVLASCRHAFLGVGLMSGMINVLYLTGSFFMLEIYDRVLPSRSVPTLIGLAVIAFVLYAFQGVLDIFRGRVLARIGASLDEALSARVFDLVVRLPLKTRASGDGLLPVRDLDQVRGFLSSLGPTALFDLPWMPLYLGICFVFHFWIGMTAVVGALILVVVTLLTEFRTREPTRAAAETGTARNALAQASRRNAEVLQAMGMRGRMGALWGSSNSKFMDSQLRASDVAGGFGAISKVMRMALQSAVLGVGAYLAIEQQATAGIIIASSILTSRALAPVELAIANWRGFVGARQSWKRLIELMAALPQREAPLPLPRPSSALSVEGVSAVPPGAQRFVVQDVTFALKAGNGLGVIGPSASGKSSLARVFVGVWSPMRGKVRLDGAARAMGPGRAWAPRRLPAAGRRAVRRHRRREHRPLRAGARPRGDPRRRQGRQRPRPHPAPAGRLRDADRRGRAGAFGRPMPARRARPRALRRPLPDRARRAELELDAEGEQALTQAILSARARGRIVVVIAHRPSALAAVDLVLMMADGKAQAFGPKDEVLSKVLRRPGPAPTEGAAAHTAGGTMLKVVESQGAAS